MKPVPEFIIVQDMRDGKVYVDNADSMLRQFEAILMHGSSKRMLLQWYPEAIDCTKGMKE